MERGLGSAIHFQLAGFLSLLFSFFMSKSRKFYTITGKLMADHQSMTSSATIEKQDTHSNTIYRNSPAAEWAITLLTFLIMTRLANHTNCASNDSDNRLIAPIKPTVACNSMPAVIKRNIGTMPIVGKRTQGRSLIDHNYLPVCCRNGREEPVFCCWSS